MDTELIQAAIDVAQNLPNDDNYTVAAAARTSTGDIVTGVNVYHFSGGPCAELVVIGAVVAQGTYRLDTIVAVGHGGRGVVPPCGRCRQILLDHFPAIRVIVGAGERLREVLIADLLPESYVWADQ
jgi:cytidine deaminase